MIRAVTASWEGAIESPVRVAPIARRKVRVRRLTDAVILAIILAASALCVEFYIRSRSELALAVNRHQAAADRVESLSIKLDKLDREVKALRTDPRAIELFAREKFGFVRSGDLVIRVKSKDDDGQAQTSQHQDHQIQERDTREQDLREQALRDSALGKSTPRQATARRRVPRQPDPQRVATQKVANLTDEGSAGYTSRSN